MPFRTVPAILMILAAPAAGQDPWAAVRQGVVEGRAPDCFSLVATKVRLDFAWYGEHALGAADGRELRLVGLEAGKAAEALAQVLKGPGWALFDPMGNRLAEGPGLPTPEQVQTLMESVGWKPPRESLKAHLRLHPEDGQAWLELAHDLASQASAAQRAELLSEPLRASLRRELLGCLQRLVDIPGAEETWRAQNPQVFPALLLFLKHTDLDRDPELGHLTRRLQAAVPRLVGQDPEARSLWLTLSWANDPTDEDFGLAARRKLLDSLDGPPGQPWPPVFLSDFLLGFYYDRPEDVFRIAAAAIATSQHPKVAGRLGRAHVLQALGAWGATQFSSLLFQGKVEEATALLASLRTQAGKGWPQVASRLGEDLERRIQYDNQDESQGVDRRLTPVQVEALRQGLKEAPVADPPAPEATLLRLALLDNETDLLAWGGLQIHEALVPWGPAELSWQTLDKIERARLRERHGWPQGQRWLLMRGDQVLASGPGLPDAPTLEAALRHQGKPDLELLGTFIRAHPERLDARRARLAMLRPRLTVPSLQRLFLEDLEAAGEPLGVLAFDPDPAVWGQAAHRVCRRASEQIQNWPFSPSTWARHASWSSIDPSIQRPAALLASLETWPRQRGLRLPGPIPLSAAKAVVEVFLQQGRQKDLDAWMQVLWERGLKDWVTQWAALPPLSRKAPGGRLDRDAPEVKKLLATWGQALSTQGHKLRLASLTQELEGLRPGLSGLLSATAR